MTEVLTIEEVAEELQVHPRTVRRAIAERGLPIVQLGRRVTRVRRVDLDAWLEEQATVRVATARHATPVPIPLSPLQRPATGGRGRRASGVLTVTPDMGRTA